MNNTQEKLTKEQIELNLRHFTGSETFYRFSLFKSLIYTEGVRYVAEVCEANWLVSDILVSSVMVAKLKKEEFLSIKFVVNNQDEFKKHAAVLTCDDGNGNILYTQKYDYTDFPLDKIKFYKAGNTLMLPSEY